MPIQQSFCLPMFPPGGASLVELLKRARAMGYPAVEIWQRDENDLRFESVLHAAHEADLTFASMCGHHSLSEGMNKRSNHIRIVNELRASIELAARHGIRGLICFSGNINPNQSDEDARLACVECLRLVAPLAEQNHVLLNLELLNSKVDHPHYQCDRTSWGVDVCRRVGSSHVKLLYDIYHMQIMEGDVIRTIRDNIQWIGHMHTAGNPGRWDFDNPDLPQELNYRGIARAIAATGYAGYLGHEFRTQSGNVPAALQAAFDVCNV